MKFQECSHNDLYLEVHEDYLLISRCSRFYYFPENHFEISFQDIPNDDESLKNLVLSYSIKKPPLFKELSSVDQKFCETKCADVFNYEVKNIVVNIFGCNLHCGMCTFTGHKVSLQMKELYERLCHIMIDSNFNISFTHRGEPFLYRNVINDYFNHKRTFTCISNLTLITDDDILKLKENNCRIYSSIDSTIEKVYRSIRTPATSEDYLKAMTNAIKLAKAGVLSANLLTITTENKNIDDLIKTEKFFEKINIPCYFGINEFVIDRDEDFIKEVQAIFPNMTWRT